MGRMFIFFIVLLMIFGCAASDIPDKGNIPIGAKVVKELGNDWVYFELDGRIFLYRFHWIGMASGRTTSECVTQIN